MLRLHQSPDIILIQCVLSSKIGQKLHIELNHFEVDEFGLQEISIRSLQLLYFDANSSTVIDYQIDFGMSASQLFVELRVARRDLVDEIVEHLRNDRFIGLAILNSNFAILGQFLDTINRKFLLKIYRFIS